MDFDIFQHLHTKLSNMNVAVDRTESENPWVAGTQLWTLPIAICGTWYASMIGITSGISQEIIPADYCIWLSSASCSGNMSSCGEISRLNARVY